MLIIPLLAVLGCGEFTGRIDGEVVDSAGGELRAEGAVVRLVPGAVDAAIVARIEVLDPAGLPAFAQVVARPLRVEPAGLVLSQVCEITLDYAGLGVAPENLTIVRIDRAASALPALAALRIDADAETLTAELTQLGEFALLAECAADADCAMDEVCMAGGCVDAPALDEICGDAIDNDSDGVVDEGCMPDPEICGDGIDNDMDGLVDEDCGAPCGADIDCGPAERCVDGTCQG